MEIQNAPNMSSSVVDGFGERDYEIFSNNFWGKDEAGYEVLTSRLRQAKQTCEDVRNMFHERALIEEEYAKRLMRISKIPIGKDESGTLRDALEVCRQELESTAKEHITLSQKIRTELEQEITHFISRQKETRKLQQAIAEKSLRNKREHAILVQKAKERYESECIKIQGLLAGKNSIMGKDLEKLNLRIEKAQMSAKTADQEYMKLVKDAQEITQKWNFDWRTACDKFQDLEEERVDSLKTFLWTYANLISTVCVADDESCERIRVSLEQCNVEKDIQIFIKEGATGPEIPEPPIYVNFYAKPPEDEVRYKIASFERVPAYIDGSTTTTLDPHSLHEYHSSQNINSNGNGYHTRNDSEDYNSMNIERAQLYANTTSNIININNYNNKNEGEVIEQVEEDPVDPRAKQMLSIGENVFEVETEKPAAKDEIAQALANMQLTDGTNNIVYNDNQNLTPTNNPTINSTIDISKLHSTGGSISGGNNPINVNGGGSNRKPLPVNYAIDKPQPPPPPPNDQTIIQQQQMMQQQQQISNIPHHQHNNSQSRIQFNPYQSNNNNSPTTVPSAIANNNGININGPGDLRRQSSESNSNGPISSQQQQISQNMSMRQSPQPQSNRSSQQQQGPGDIRRMSNPNSSSTTPTLTQVSQQGGYQPQQIHGQMISQDQIDRQIISQGLINNNNDNSSNLNRSDTMRTTSTNSSNNSLGIQLDIHGRVKQDDLAEAYITNGGRLPPESARFQMTQGIPQGVQQQISPISPQGQVYNNFNLPINQSSYRGQPQQVVRQLPQQVQQQLNRSNTLNSNATLASAYHHQQQQGNPRTTLQGSVGVQQQQQIVGGQLAGQLAGQPQQQINFQDPNFYTAPIMAQYQRPPVGGGANFQQIQVAQQHHLHRQLPQFGLQPMARSIQLQYQQPLIIPIDTRQRTEDGKPIEFYVKALYDYQKTIPEEISFTAGDVIAVLNTHSDGWWEGEILDDTRRNRGLFPSNYTEILR